MTRLLAIRLTTRPSCNTFPNFLPPCLKLQYIYINNKRKFTGDEIINLQSPGEKTKEENYDYQLRSLITYVHCLACRDKYTGEI